MEHAAAQAPAEGPFHILVVDDEPDVEPLIRQRLRRHVRRGDDHPHFAGDGAHALETLRGAPEIEMVVTDINMPRMDGLTLLAELATAAPDVKAVVVSAHGDMANIRTAMNRGAFDFVTKPLDFADFEVTLERTRRHIAQWKDAQRSRDQTQGDIADVAADLGENMTRIVNHSERANRIVSDMLSLRRDSARGMRPVALNALVHEQAMLPYHAARAESPELGIQVSEALDEAVGEVNAMGTDLGRVVINVVSNACQAMAEKAQGAGDGYAARLRVATHPATHPATLGDARRRGLTPGVLI